MFGVSNVCHFVRRRLARGQRPCPPFPVYRNKCSALLLLATVGAVHGADVGWLADVTTPPANPPRERLGTIAPLLVDEQGQAITTREAWERQRQVVRAAWLKFLGPMPDPRPPVKLEVLKTEALGATTRQLVRYEGEPGLFVEGYLLLPGGASRDARKRPAIVALHPTTNLTIDEIAGVSGSEARQTGWKLASRGFVVFCPRCFLWQDVSSLDEAVKRHRARHPETLGMAKMLYDAVRAVDVVASLPEVDANRIGVFGHSLGARRRCTSPRSTSVCASAWPARAASGSDPRTGMRPGIWVRPFATRASRSTTISCWH